MNVFRPIFTIISDNFLGYTKVTIKSLSLIRLVIELGIRIYDLRLKSIQTMKPHCSNFHLNIVQARFSHSLKPLYDHGACSVHIYCGSQAISRTYKIGQQGSRSRAAVNNYRERTRQQTVCNWKTRWVVAHRSCVG